MKKDYFNHAVSVDTNYQKSGVSAEIRLSNGKYSLSYFFFYKENGRQRCERMGDPQRLKSEEIYSTIEVLKQRGYELKSIFTFDRSVTTPKQTNVEYIIL